VPRPSGALELAHGRSWVEADGLRQSDEFDNINALPAAALGIANPRLRFAPELSSNVSLAQPGAFALSD
jgi:hypothetical protein